jgi:hypothetical protein
VHWLNGVGSRLSRAVASRQPPHELTKGAALPKTPACLQPARPARAKQFTECRSPSCTNVPGPSGWCEHHARLFAEVRDAIEMDFRHGCPRHLVGRDRHSLRIRAAAVANRAAAEAANGPATSSRP